MPGSRVRTMALSSREASLQPASFSPGNGWMDVALCLGGHALAPKQASVGWRGVAWRGMAWHGWSTDGCALAGVGRWVGRGSADEVHNYIGWFN